MTGPERVIHLAAYDNPQTGSFIPMLIAALSEARSRGCEAEAWIQAAGPGAYAWEADFERAAVPIRFAPTGNRRLMWSWLSDQLDQDGTGKTILQTHFAHFDVPAVAAAAGRRDVSVYWHEHSALSSAPVVVLRNLLKFGALTRGVERILCPSTELTEAVAWRLAPRRKIEFLPNAIDASRFPLPSDGERMAARSRLGLPADTAVLLHFGWNWSLKGGDLFLEAVRLLRQAGRDFLAITVTRDPAASRGRDELGLREAVAIVPPADARELYAAADLFVSTSRSEGGTPFALMEALASGVPLVATDLPGNEFVCRANPRARLTSVNPAEIAATVGQALDAPSPDRREEARADIEERFSLQRWARHLCDLYERPPPRS